MNIIFIILVLVILFASIVFHEFFHAKVADILGDSTPRYSGRLTFNPIPHIDPIGAIFPIFMLLSGSPFIFGWAKPVPINANNFKDSRKGMLYVSLAGPISNLFLAWCFAMLIKFMPIPNNELVSLLSFGLRINVLLAVFNLIPVPPLDGSHVLEAFLPYKYSHIMFSLQQYGFLIIIFIIIFPPTNMLLGYIINFIIKVLMMRL